MCWKTLFSEDVTKNRLTKKKNKLINGKDSVNKNNKNEKKEGKMQHYLGQSTILS